MESENNKEQCGYLVLRITVLERMRQEDCLGYMGHTYVYSTCRVKTYQKTQNIAMPLISPCHSLWGW